MSVHAPQRPRYAPMRQLPVAVVHPGVGRRILAQLCDTLIVLGPGACVYLVTRNPVLAGVVSLELVLFQILSEARCGATLGKWLLGLRAAKVNSLYAPGLARALVRSLVLGLGHLVAGLGQFVMIAAAAGDREGGQGWHDRPARTTVLDVRAGLRASSFSGAAATPGDASSAALDPAAGGGRAAASAAPPTQSGPTQAVPTPAAPAQADPPQAVPPAPTGQAAQPAVTAGSAPAPAPPAAVPAAAPPSEPVGSAVPAPAAAAARAATIHLIGEAMEPILIAGAVFVGRAPTPPGNEAATAVAIPDEQRSLSRTHARLDPRGAQLVVTDLGSANGTFLVAADGSAHQLEPNRPTPVPAGSSVALGSKLFTVRIG